MTSSQLPTGVPIAHPIPTGLISAGGTGAQNYDEFATDREITAVIAANRSSMLGVEMPHRTPEAVAAGWGFADALPHAVERLAALRAEGHLVPFTDAVAVYRVGADSYGVFCLIDTDQISTTPDEPGLVIRNEDVFVEKVAERTALTRALGVLTSPVLLMQTGQGAELHAFLATLLTRLGAPTVTDVDHHGHEHALWLLGPGPDRDRVLALAGGGELVVADGNHRSLAAQRAGLTRFLAVVTTPESVTIQPYHRLLRRLDQPLDTVLMALAAAGADVRRVGTTPPTVPTTTGTVALYGGGATYEITLDKVTPPVATSSVVDRLDHAVLERVLLGDVLGLDPGDPAIGYIGGDYPASWLAAQVDRGEAIAAVLIAPVTVPDFVAVNLARLKLPRKSTWFTPKARAGLVLAEVPAAAPSSPAARPPSVRTASDPGPGPGGRPG